MQNEKKHAEKRLTEEQARVAVHTTGPSIVVAGAGTGKTSTVCARVAHLVNTGAPPSSILMMTFTKAAAKDMVEHVREVVGPMATGITAGTFHSVGVNQLRIFGAHVGDADPTTEFEVIGTGEAADVMDLVRGTVDKSMPKDALEGLVLPDRRQMPAIRSDMMNRRLSLAQTLALPRWETYDGDPKVRAYIGEVFEAFDLHRQAHAQLTFDDIMEAWLRLLGEQRLCCARYEHVIVDEAQDMNAVQHELLRAIARNMLTDDVMVVGDAAQSIYGWRGSCVREFDDFADTWHATTYRLTHNFRSLPAITDVANAVLEGTDVKSCAYLVPTRPDGANVAISACRDPADQANVALDAVRLGLMRGSVAVIARSARTMRDLETRLKRASISYDMRGGTPFCELSHVRDVLALLKFCDGTMNQWSLHRLLTAYPGIGPGIATKIVETDEPDPLAADATMARAGRKQADVRHACQDLAATRRRLMETPWPQAMAAACAHVARLSEQAERARAARRRTPMSPSDAEKAAEKARGIRRDMTLLQSLASEVASAREFADAFKLETPTGHGDDNLTLTTIHSAKGLEWDSVIVLGCDDETFPGNCENHDEEEEMRRCLYVAVTRARDSLLCLWPKRVAFSTRAPWHHPSRYFEPATLLPTVDITEEWH